MTEKHSPLPWEGDGSKETTEDINYAHIFSADNNIIAGCKPEDAALILKCVNMHEELVKALNEVSKCGSYNAAVVIATHALNKIK